MICSMCHEALDLIEGWFTLIVTDPGEDGEITAGHLCSLDCLTSYVALVYAMEMDEDHG